jgi:hypothetical protein
MALLTVDVGEVELLSRAVNKTAPDNLRLKLYSNDKTPADADTVASYTEVTGSGYADKVLTGASWTVSSITNVATASYAQQSFDFTGAANVYGYYVTNNAGTILLWAERFTSPTPPWMIPAGGGVVKVTPIITLNKA